jgi:hypothetical protein
MAAWRVATPPRACENHANWTVAAEGSGSKVTLEATWDGAGGIGGVFEGLFAPRGLRRIYVQVLERLSQAVGRE